MTFLVKKELMSKKKQYEKKRFESNCSPSDTSANIYISMLMSKAWRELTARQCKLYLYCKSQYYAEKKKPIKDNQLSFTMNKSKWDKLYGLYNEKNHKYFYNDMTALIEKGFITCYESGAITRTKSIYIFSDKWHYYGTDKFELSLSEMTQNGRSKIKNAGVK